MIAKVDSTKNEIDGVDIEGFPTIKMFKKESNEEIEYIGRIIVFFLWVQILSPKMSLQERKIWSQW